MTTTRRPEDVTDEEIDRLVGALDGHKVYLTFTYGRFREAIASGLLVPPPRERTQMEKDEEEWSERRHQLGGWTYEDVIAFDRILCRLLPAAKAAGVTY